MNKSETCLISAPSIALPSCIPNNAVTSTGSSSHKNDLQSKLRGGIAPLSFLVEQVLADLGTAACAQPPPAPRDAEYDIMS